MADQKKTYKQRFRDSWLKEDKYKLWLMPMSGDPFKAFCKFCKCAIESKKASLEKHATSAKHLASVPHQGLHQPTLDDLASSLTPAPVQQAEATLALFVAEHCAMNSVDHLGEACRGIFDDSKVASKIRMHRTKCTNVIKNVLGPHFASSLRDDVGEQKYSVLMDESTDISVVKVLGIVIRYFSLSNSGIVSTFLALQELKQCNAEGIASALIDGLRAKGLKPENLVGVGVDNASVMTGVNSGVYVRLRQDLPRLVMVRCVCHSVQLAVSHASSCLPRNVEFLVRETYRWFSHSAARRLEYRDLYREMNDGETPLAIPQACDTRWLSIYTAVSRILAQWDTLREVFHKAQTDKNCYTAMVLAEMFKDPTNRCYLSLLEWVLAEAHRVNKSYQAEKQDPTKLFGDLVGLVRSMAAKVSLPTSRYDIFTVNIEEHLDLSPYFGYQFETAVKGAHLSVENEKDLRLRARRFIVELFNQLRQRLPENIQQLQKASVLSVDNALKRVQEPITELASQFLPDKDVSACEAQWRNLHHIKWCSTGSTEDFWAEVSSYKDAQGENPFAEISSLAMTVLSLPFSNAGVERCFSDMNVVKSKLRNRLELDTLNAILHVRSGLRRIKKKCHEYRLPHSVLRRIGTMSSYETEGEPLQAAEIIEELQVDDL